GTLADIDNNLWGLTIGADAPFGEGFRAGGHLGMAKSDFDVPRRGDRSDGDQWYLGVHFSYAPRPDGGAWVQGAAGYATSSFDVTRPVHVGVFDRTARADADADGWYAMAEAGWRFETPSASIEPLVGVYHSRLSLDDVTETGAGEANLR
ncbi:autotransporter outer membrane beta-barrel domain-containing protein, partial [Kocuria sp. KH4]